MTPLRERVARLFLEPAEPDEDARFTSATAAPPTHWLPPAASPAVAPIPPTIPTLSAPTAVLARAPRVGVVCGPRESRVAGAAVALGLLGPAAARIGVVLAWNGLAGAGRADRAASPTARRCAAALRDGGAAAWACGRLVHVALPASEEAAAADAAAMVPGLTAPVAILVSGPRGTPVEALLAEQDRIVLARSADGDAELAGLALGQLADLGPPVAELALPAAPAAAALARTGTRLAAPLRAAVAAALGHAA